MNLKESWCQVLCDLGKLGYDLGKTTIATVKVGAEKLDAWIDKKMQEKKACSAEAPVECTAEPACEKAE